MSWHPPSLPVQDLDKNIATLRELLGKHYINAVTFRLPENILNNYLKAVDHINKLEKHAMEQSLSAQYISLFTNQLNMIFSCLPYNFPHLPTTPITEERLEQTSSCLAGILETLGASLTFFENLKFSKNNIVAIGANGSGKTSWTNQIKGFLPQEGVVISAQKILLIPTLSQITKSETTSNNLKSSQNADKTLRTSYPTDASMITSAYAATNDLIFEFKALIENLVAERGAMIINYFNQVQKGENPEIPVSKLDKCVSIWNLLFPHRSLECSEGINLIVKSTQSESYQASQMSDGEKVAFYFIAQVIQAPKDGFIVVDEPEMYLHKTLVEKLWDTLEKKRQDCIFVYLTHDLHFAASRLPAAKLWIKSFQYPNKWEIVAIPENEIPEPLILELLGSKQNILFCEGKKELSIDEKIYRILLPHFHIVPVESCFNVINYTKAANKISPLAVKAFGLIDSDHHGTQRLDSLKQYNIYSFSLSETENLFLDEDFITALAKKVLTPEFNVEAYKKDIISDMFNKKDEQIAKYVSTKIDYYFKDSHISEGNSLNKLQTNYSNFLQKVNVEVWFSERQIEVDALIANQDYNGIIKAFNNKGLRKIAEKHLNIPNFVERSIMLLLNESSTHTILLKYFPKELQSS